MQVTFGDTTLNIHNDHIGNIIRQSKTYYEHHILLKLKEYGFKTIIDIGANIGNHSVFFYKEMGATVYSIEPINENYELLLKNTEGYPIKTFQLGISDANGYMYQSKDISSYKDGNVKNMGMCYLETEGNIEIEVKTVDQFVNDNNIDNINLIKIDVEGMEQEVLNGSSETLTNQSPYIFIECQGKLKEGLKDTTNEVKNILSKYGYVIEKSFSQRDHLFKKN